MTNVLAVAEALQAIAITIPGVAVENDVPQVFIGPHEAWPSTPAAEVIVDDLSVRAVTAGQHQQLISGFYHVVYYVALEPNMSGHELRLLPIVDAFIARFRQPGFDRTLGGLTEDVSIERVTFDVTRRNNQSYRVAAFTLRVGEDLEGIT